MRAILAAVGCSAAAGGILGVWTASLNPPLSPSSTLLLTAWFALLAACVLVPIVAVAASARRLDATAALVLCSIVLFVFVWLPQLTPAHRLYGYGVRMTMVGSVYLIGVGAALALIAWCGLPRRDRSRGKRLAAAGVIFATAWTVLIVAGRLTEPPRDRSAAAQRTSPAGGARSEPPPVRVLLIAVDGLDWNAIDALTTAGRLPSLRGVLARARTYQLDNHGLGLSPGIWSRIYTGAAGDRVHGFSKWVLPGVRRPIVFLPEWHHRPLFMLDGVLDAGVRLGAWNTQRPTNADFLHAPFWRVASSAGAHVAVFDPLPFDLLGERVNGVFAWESDDGFRAATSDSAGRAEVAAIPVPPSAAGVDGLLEDERIRVRIAADIFRRERPAIGIYYTHALDSAGHLVWEPRQPDGPANRSLPFERSPVAAAYDVVDSSILTLVDAFGGPAVIVVVSDHGWDFTGYAHRLAPMGVVMIAGAAQTGYGGTIPAESIAATVLAFAGVPISQAMSPPIRDLLPHWQVCADCRTPAPVFLSVPGVDDERMKRLRSLGYIAR